MEIKEGYDRVTEIISKFSGINSVPEEILRRAGERGTKVHNHIEAMLSGFEMEIDDEEIKPYLESFKEFWNDSKQIKGDSGKVILEQRLYCDKLMITGCIDCIIQTFDRTYLFDWKTSAKESNQSWRMQAALYKYLLLINGYKDVDDAVFVKLDKKGKGPLIFKYDSYVEDIEIAFGCISVFRFFNKGNAKSKFFNKGKDERKTL